jgi:polysaccharide export outer membrane protein
MRRIVLTFLLMLLTVPAALAQSASYRIQPGDQLQITVLEDETLNRQLLVTPDGQISVPLAGTVRVAGQTVGAVEEIIADRLTSNFAVRPNVFVALTAVDPSAGLFKVFVLGQVNTPGEIEVEAGTTLLQALALAGGPSNFAAAKRIQLRRTDASGQERLYLFNYRAVERGGSIQSMIALRDGDVIVVPERRLFE